MKESRSDISWALFHLEESIHNLCNIFIGSKKVTPYNSGPKALGNSEAKFEFFGPRLAAPYPKIVDFHNYSHRAHSSTWYLIMSDTTP